MKDKERKNRHPSSRGTSLLELMLGMVIFSTVLLWVGQIAKNNFSLLASSWNRSQAVTDLQAVCEEIRRVSVGDFDAVASKDWTQWAKDNRLDSLTEETVTVTVEDPAANALNLKVKVQWSEDERTHSVRVNTLTTRRVK